MERDDGRVAEAESSFPETTLDEVAGCFVYDGVPKRVKEFDVAIDQAMQNRSFQLCDVSLLEREESIALGLLKP